MLAPARLVYALRPHAAVGLLAAAASVAALFAATPFLIPEIADRFGVSLGAAGLVSTVQVGGFAAANFLAGRRLKPSRAILAGSAAAAVAANLASAAVDDFGWLMALRLVAGICAGLITWLAWSDAMQEAGVMRDVAAIGPLTALAASPLLGWLAATSGDQAVYLLLAVVSAPAIAIPTRLITTSPTRRRMSPSRSNLVLLLALGVLTAAGSSLFIYAASAARKLIDLSPVVIALGYSFNAATGLAATRLRAAPGSAGLWLLGTAASAAAMILIPHPVVFFAAMGLWGFAFWMAIPEVLRQLAAWSLSPAERVGDAQGLMAVGRALGPLVGAALVGSGSFTTLSIEASLGLATAAAIIGGVEWYRRGRRAPVAAVAAD